jgi:hypothetical protein
VTSREWNGRMHRVAVLVDGFAWNGRTYPSVSKIALPITGTRWNDTAGRPGRRLDFQRQYDRKPLRCQRITVSGRMMASASQVFGNNLPTISDSNATRVETARTRPKIDLMRPKFLPSMHGPILRATPAGSTLR